jgi:hypothetical protein
MEVFGQDPAQSLRHTDGLRRKRCDSSDDALKSVFD